ncbi:hypothetical protein KAU87_02120, partial [Candidatus Bathyarchaeota archaeon]|nr:hypothetical protein [Candidatus Bathyarchaeota archaeon]
KIFLRLGKAAFKSAVVYILFSIFSTIVAPFEGFADIQPLSIAFLAIYIFFIFAIELTRGSIFQHIFNIVNSLLIVAYIIQVLNMGVINVSLNEFSLMIDLRFFLSIFAIGGFLGFAKSMLQLLNWMNEREEYLLKTYTRSL